MEYSLFNVLRVGDEFAQCHALGHMFFVGLGLLERRRWKRTCHNQHQQVGEAVANRLRVERIDQTSGQQRNGFVHCAAGGCWNRWGRRLQCNWLISHIFPFFTTFY